MKTATALKFEGEVTEDGQLHVELPSGVLRGPVLVTLEALTEEALLLSEEDLRGAGLTAAEIAASPEIGSWAEDREMPSGAEYVEHLRAAAPRYSW
ncbi:MAG: hypothetical protein ABJC13_21440 [Acidobacteriota bacterium]